MIKTEQLDEYPIKVIILTDSFGKPNQVVWEGSQRNLFRKYATQREQSVKQIQEACKNLAAAMQ
jgi:hypothetical protein